MDKKPISDIKAKPGVVTPEVLSPQSAKGTGSSISTAASASKLRNRLYHTSYRPSHKATFIGLAVVALILGINVAVIMLLMKNDSASSDNLNQNEVTISADVLSGLGVNNASNNKGALLTVNPDASFKGNLTIAGDTSVSGKLNLNNKITATDASLTKLEAGQTTIQDLNVNGDITTSNLNVRTNLIVAGSSSLQGAVTMSQLLTVNNNVNISGSLSIGGTLSTRGFQAGSLVSDTTLTIGGHVLTRGSAPSYNRGSNLRDTDTISMSGNDASGTVVLNVGAGSIGSGCFVSASFVQAYSNIPHIVVTPVGPAKDVYTFRSAGGFSICIASSLSYGGYAFDYIVMQ